MIKVEIAYNDSCLETEEFKIIVEKLKEREDLDLKLYNEDTLKGRRRANTLKYKNSARMIPFILMHNKKNVQALYTENEDIKYEKIDDFLSTGESENYINLFTSDRKLFAKYYPDVDKIIKVENDNS